MTALPRALITATRRLFTTRKLLNCDPTGARDLNCTMAEAATIYNNMLQQTRRNIHWVMIGLGPYRVADCYADQQISTSVWHKLSEKEKTAKLKWVDPKYQSKIRSTVTSQTPAAQFIDLRDDDSSSGLVTSGSPPSTTVDTNRAPVTSGDSLLGDFAMTNLPEIFKGSWNNAEKNHCTKRYRQSPWSTICWGCNINNQYWFPPCVNEEQKLSSKMQLCLLSRPWSVCPHLGCGIRRDLKSVISNYKPNISTMVKPKGKTGKKPKQSTTRRKVITGLGGQDTEGFSDPLSDGNLVTLR